MPTGIYKRQPMSQEHKKNIGLANLGKKMSKKSRKKVSMAKKGKSHFNQRGEKHPRWKGNNAKIGTIHDWISKWKGVPKKCEMCGTEKAKKYEWANIDHKYNRILEDYIRMCTSCHRLYDIKNNNYKRTIPKL